MKRGLLAAAAAFGAALAVVVGLRLEQAGLAVLVGVLCGIAAALPMSAAVLYLLAREREARLQAEERWRSEARLPAAAPPVLILNAGRGAETPPPYPLLGERSVREFTIVGEEEK